MSLFALLSLSTNLALGTLPNLPANLTVLGEHRTQLQHLTDSFSVFLQTVMQGHVRVAFERLIDERVRHVAHDLDQPVTSRLVRVLPSVHDSFTRGPLRLAGQYMRHIL